MSSIWDDLDKEASVDNRIGTHDFTVDKINEGEWEHGRAYRELDGRLVTSDNFNLRQRFNVTPSEEVVQREKGNWDQRTKKSVNYSHQMDVVLEKEYGVTLAGIKEGDTLRVLTGYETDKNNKEKKYVKIVKFLPKTAPLSGNGNSSDVPF
jgi:hypothetical protein